MGRFADAHIGALGDAELDAFERLTDVPEPELYAWITGDRPVAPEHDTPLFRQMREFARTGPK